MNTWLSSFDASELLGITARSVIRRAEAQKWDSRKKLRGKGLEYSLESIIAGLNANERRKFGPYLTKIQAGGETATESFQAGKVDAQIVQLRDDTAAEVSDRIMTDNLAQGVLLKGNAADRDAAKHVVYGLFLEYKRAHSSGPIDPEKLGKNMVADFVSAYNRGEIKVDEKTRSIEPSISVDTVYRIHGNIKQGKHLGGSYGSRRGCGLIDTQPAIKEYIIGLLTDKPYLSNIHVYDGLTARFGEDPTVKLPSKRPVEKWISAWKLERAEIYTAVSNPNAYNSKYRPAAGSLECEYVNERWMMDTTPSDLTLEDGKRYAILGCLDVYSRRLRFLVAPTSTASAVSLLVRRCLLDWGVPKTIKVDNGQDYKSLHVQRGCHYLGIELDFSKPFSPWEKGTMERAFRTVSHGIFKGLPQYKGHNVAAQQAIRDGKSFAAQLMKKDAKVEVGMTREELQTFLNRFANIYEHEQHSGIKTTPYLRALQCREPIRSISDERQLDMLLAETPSNDGWRTVTKKCTVSVGAYQFFSDVLAGYIGKKVQVLEDFSDMGKVIVIGRDRPEDPMDIEASRPGLHFVCVAYNTVLEGISRQEMAEKAAEINAATAKKKRADIRKLKSASGKARPQDVVEEILAHKEKQIAAIVAFPKPKIEYTSPGIEAAKEALDALENDGWAPDSPRTLEDAAEVAERLEERKRHHSPPLEFPGVYERALYLMAELMAGVQLSGEADQFMRLFQVRHPKSVKMLDANLNGKYEDDWDRYQQQRASLGWSKTWRK